MTVNEVWLIYPLHLSSRLTNLVTSASAAITTDNEATMWVGTVGQTARVPPIFMVIKIWLKMANLVHMKSLAR